MVRDGQALFSGGLRNVFALADLKMNRLLDTFDEWALTSGRDGEFGAPERFAPTRRAPIRAPAGSTCATATIRTVVWATGFRPDYDWLDVPVLDDKGRLRHDGGVADSPGLYALGLPVLRRRKSTFIHGIEDDAREVIDHLAGYLAARESSLDDALRVPAVAGQRGDEAASGRTCCPSIPAADVHHSVICDVGAEL